MPRLDFNEVGSTQKFPPLPRGRYLCQIADVNETTTRNGHEMWKVRFEVTEGGHEGRYIFDNLVFEGAGLKRVKLLCAALGVHVSGEVDLTPDKLQGRTCYVEVEIEDYESKEGVRKTHNAVPFSGFHRIEPVTTGPNAQGEEMAEDDVPF